MKSTNKFILAALLLVSLAGCVGYVGGGGYYGGGPWVQDDVFIGGGRGWYGRGGYVHPGGGWHR
jgi:hypothetical protein